MIKPLFIITALPVAVAFLCARQASSCTLDTECGENEMCANGQCAERTAADSGIENSSSNATAQPTEIAPQSEEESEESISKDDHAAASAPAASPTPDPGSKAEAFAPSTAMPEAEQHVATPAPTISFKDDADEARGVLLDFYTPVIFVDYFHPIGDDHSSNYSEDDDLYMGFGPMSGLRFGIGIGGVVNEHITVGARVILGVAVVGDVNLAYGLLPYFNFAFGNHRIKPFIEVDAGVIGNAGDLFGDSVSFAFAAGPGLRFLCGSRAAVDLWLNETLTVGSALYFDNPYAAIETDDSSYFGSNTGLMLGLDVLI